MVSLKGIEVERGFQNHGFDQRKAQIKMPLVDGRSVNAEVTVHLARQRPAAVVLTLKGVEMHADHVDARDGMLKEKSEDLGVLSEVSPPSHVAPLLAAFLKQHGIDSTDLSLEVTKCLNRIIFTETNVPQRTWTVLPEVPSDGMGFAKYLLMQREGTPIDCIFGWIPSGSEHHAIRAQHDTTAVLGGGFVALYEPRLFLTGESTTYFQPPFEVVYDAALGLTLALRPHIQITEAKVEGIEKFSLIQQSR